MVETSASLLERLRGGAEEAWDRFVELYKPLIVQWLRRYALQAADSDDLAQQVLFAVVRKLPEFQHNQRPGAFRNWLRTITVNELRAFWRRENRRPCDAKESDLQSMLDELADPHSQLSQLWNDEHDRHVVETLLRTVEPEISRKSWLAFRRTVREGKRAREVAAELDMSINAVLITKSRVLRRLRQQAEHLAIDSRFS